ncbi:ribosome rescue GTPase HflX [Dongshaea marina]|uniref:ribosome rescue GTPase HflX n=1 Tax=Dongshaea marina TaxID=2047966 RepID=UPI000D3EB535|nr:ribosome rescue GTPase HflX [Dongshaea marina]
MFDRYEVGEQAILVHVYFADESESEDLDELKLLADSAGVETLAVVTSSRKSVQPKYFVGSGKAEEIAQEVRAQGANLVIVNHALTPAQERNLEQLLQCRVLDRTGLILDIFAQRARTHEGKLQVELAQLRHIASRLVRGWTHLERQKGGIGLRGPGETQLETDRRLIRERIRYILKRLEKVEKRRAQGRRSRQRNEVPTASMVGYTNAGKSTLFNRLTQSDVYAADQLFATLDPTLRRIEVKDVGEVVMADTVGFIRHLPHELVAAFRATLLETREADLLLHVIDCADDNMQENMDEVTAVLDILGADEIPALLVYNKIDCLDGFLPRIERDEQGHASRVWLSAKTGEGCDLLLQALSERLAETMVNESLSIPPAAARLRGLLYQYNCIESERFDDEGNSLLDIRLARTDWMRLLKLEGEHLQRFIVPK